MPDEPAAVETQLPEQDQRDSFNAAMAAAPAPIFTYALVALNVILFLARVILNPASGQQPAAQRYIAWGADFGPLTLHGQWWRVITACFLHLSVMHIAMNMFILLLVGTFSEKIFGNLRFLVIYLLAGVGGNIAGLYDHPLTIAAGASGAVFGIYGALLGFLLVQRHVIPSDRAWGLAKSAGIFIFYNLLYGLYKINEIDMAAHIGGLLTGFVVGAALARPLSSDGQRHHFVRTAAVAVCGTAAAFACMAALSKQHKPQEELLQQLLAGNGITVGTNDRVVYSGSATKAEAQSLGQALIKTGYFRKPNAAVLLSKDTGGTIVSLITDEKEPAKAADGSTPATAPRLIPYPWENPDYLAGVQALGATIAPTVGGPPIRIAILNRDGLVEKTVAVDQHIATIGLKDSVWYSGSATEQDAQALGTALQTNKFFRDLGARVYLSKSSSGSDISFLVNDGAWDDPRISQSFQQLGQKLAKSLGGQPLQLHLIDRRLEIKKDLPIR